MGCLLSIWPGHKIRSSEFRHVCYRINILGSQLSPSSINLVPAQAGKVTGLASHWPCDTDKSGTTTYGLTALERERSTPSTFLWSVAHFTFSLTLVHVHIMDRH